MYMPYLTLGVLLLQAPPNMFMGVYIVNSVFNTVILLIDH